MNLSFVFISPVFHLFVMLTSLSDLRSVWRPGAASSLSSNLQLHSGSFRETFTSSWDFAERRETQEDERWLQGAVENRHPSADPAAADGEGEPAAGGWGRLKLWDHDDVCVCAQTDGFTLRILCDSGSCCSGLSDSDYSGGAAARRHYRLFSDPQS